MSACWCGDVVSCRCVGVPACRRVGVSAGWHVGMLPCGHMPESGFSVMNLGNLGKIRHDQGCLAEGDFPVQIWEIRTGSDMLRAGRLSIGWWLTTGPPLHFWLSVGWELMTGPPGRQRLAFCQHTWQFYQAKLSIGW